MRPSSCLALLSAAALAACVHRSGPAEAPDVSALNYDEVNPWPDAAPEITQSPAGPETAEQRAARLRAKAILVDGHSGVPSLLFGGSFDRVSPDIDLAAAELARIKEAGAAGVFFSIHVRAPWQDASARAGDPTRRALDLIDAIHRQVERHPRTLVLARKASDVLRAEREGRVAVLMGVEGGHAIESSLSALRSFYRLGVRTMTLTYTTTNDWADSAGGAGEPGYVQHRGLSAFGEAVVREMQRIGMLVDVSHASDSTFQAVMKVAAAPVITSSTMPADGHRRRPLDDYMLRAVAENGGVVMVNAWALFLDEAYADQSASFVQRHGAHLNALVEKSQGDTARALREEIERLRAQEAPIAPPPLSVIVDHIDHVVKVAGINHVGLGSSFGAVDVLHEGPAGGDGLARITLELVRRGYMDEDIVKLLGRNFLRVFEQAEAHAASTETTLSGDGSTRKLSATELGELRELSRPHEQAPSSPPPQEPGRSWMEPPPPPPKAAPRPARSQAPEPSAADIMLAR